ncbi:MAG: Flp family type IVb pilin [Sphingomonas sp.]|nr:Flp family type IVb pilin [Sphingomonas sp.]MDX3886119.1 Flp family type IVb pilin [Sphingomonas sp.]
MMKLLDRLKRNQRGASAVEYGLILAVIALVMIGALINVADATNGLWGRVTDKVTNG